MVKILNKFWPLFLLAILEVLLFSRNYTPGTYFLGWDALMPEMNFSENFRRSFFGVWQQYRGLGLLDTMSFAANIPHYLFVYFLSFFMSLSLLRYFFIFLMHFLGGIGVYFLIAELLGNQPKVKWAAISGALFYLFNLGTIQMFFVPYEVFTVHFAFLPVLILLLIKFLKSRSKRHLIYFFLLSFLSAPQAHVPMLFIVFLLALVAVLAFHLLFSKKKGIAPVALVITVTFAANSFWGLPYTYSAINNAQTVADSKINQMATEEIYLKNKAYGNLMDVLLLKGFSLSFVDNQAPGGSYMMDQWRAHSQHPVFAVIGLGLFTLSLIGFLDSIRYKEKRFYPFILMFTFAFLILADDTPAVSSFSALLRQIPYFDQIFRFTFTKFAILYAFSASILLGLGSFVLIHSINTWGVNLFRPRGGIPLYPRIMSKLKHMDKILLTSFLLVLLYYSLPAWQGNFLYRAQQLKVPKEYFMLVDFFKNQDKNSRVALIPQTSLWGWTYTKWGYQGSGFVWYGIPQATLDGAFYPWSRENENYYWELTQAFFQKNTLMFESLLDKYQISWIVVDRNLRSPFSANTDYNLQIGEVIEKSDKVKLKATFGQIRVYQVNLSHALENFTFMETNLPVVGPNYRWGSLDQGYADYGNYISTLHPRLSTLDSFYPFRSLFTARKQEELEFQVESQPDHFSFKSNIPQNLVGGKLVIPALDAPFNNDLMVLLDGEVIEFDMDNLPAEVSLPYIKKGVLELRVPKRKDYNINPAALNLQPKTCNRFNTGVYRYETDTKTGNFLKMISIGSDNCLNLPLNNLAQKSGYLVSVENRHQEGKAMLFAVINQTSHRAELEVNLPKNKTAATSYFIIPPMDGEGAGYTLYFDNISIGRVKTVNDLGTMTVDTIPYRFLTSLKVIKTPSNNYLNTAINIKTDHPNPSLYKVIVSGNQTAASTNQAILVLSQSFDKGWRVYQIRVKSQESRVENVLGSYLPFFFGKELTEHVPVNNWENGWILDPQLLSPDFQVIIVYLPQYLEYFGFGLLPVTFIWLVLTKGKKYG